MRLWTLHPRYLDSQGLVALWREALLAQRVLSGGTRGYRHHPQLERFRAIAEPERAIASYLRGVAEEAAARGFRFDVGKIGATPGDARIEATAGQLEYEWLHLMAKLARRSPDVAARHGSVSMPVPHPLFQVVPGPIASWERPNG